MSRDDRDLLDDVLERIHLTAEFTQGDRDTFMQSRLIQEAVIRNLKAQVETILRDLRADD